MSDMDQNMHTYGPKTAATLKWTNRIGFGLVLATWAAIIIAPLWERVVG